MSRLAAGLAAIIGGAVAWFVGDLNLPENLQFILAGLVGLAGTALFPSWKAQFDEAKAQLTSVVTLLVVLALDWLVTTQLALPDTSQSAILAAITALASIFAPSLTLQQASTFRAPNSQGDSRPSS